MVGYVAHRVQQTQLRLQRKNNSRSAEGKTATQGTGGGVEKVTGDAAGNDVRACASASFVPERPPSNVRRSAFSRHEPLQAAGDPTLSPFQARTLE